MSSALTLAETMPTATTPAKTHIVIPARFKSTRLPGKPLLKIHGKPMILWVANTAYRMYSTIWRGWHRYFFFCDI